MSDVAVGADWNDDVVEGGSVGRREVGVRALTAFDHVALIARLLTRLTVTKLQLATADFSVRVFQIPAYGRISLEQMLPV